MTQFTTDQMEDYVWKFSVPALSAEDQLEDDPLVEMVRRFFEDFLAIGFLTKDGQRVPVDGFTFLNSPSEIFSLFRDGRSPDAGRREWNQSVPSLGDGT